MQISRVPSRTVIHEIRPMISIAIRGALIFAVIVFIKIIFAPFCLTVKSFIRMLALFFHAALRAICHGAGGIEHEDGRGFAGVLLGLLQDDFQRDIIRVVTRFRCSLVDTFDAIGQLRSRSALLPLLLVVVFTDHDIGILRRGLAVPFCRQRDGREQADGQDQRQQQGYDSFHHFFFSPYVWFNFFVFFFRFSMCNGRGAGV